MYSVLAAAVGVEITYVPAGTTKFSPSVPATDSYGVFGAIRFGAELVPILSDFTEKINGDRIDT